MIIFLYGDDSFRAKQKLAEIKQKFIAEVDSRGDSLFTVAGENAKFSEIVDLAKDSSLFSRRNMVIIGNIFKNKDKHVFTELTDFFQFGHTEESVGNIIIFQDESIGPNPFKEKKVFWEFLKKQKFSQEFKKLSLSETNLWTRDEARKMGSDISLAAAAELVSLTSGDLWRIRSELGKLANYQEGISKSASGGSVREISKEDIEMMVIGDFDQKVFSLTEALASKNRQTAVRLLEERFAEGVALEALLGAIIWQFKKLLEIRQALDNGLASSKISASLKIHPFVVQKSMSQVRNFSLEGLKNMHAELMEIYQEARRDRDNAEVCLGIFAANI
jgi:DNA polymerase-3 subunit delta